MKRLSALSIFVLASVLLMTSCNAGNDARGGNSLPVAVDDSYTTNKNISLSIGASGILGNDTDSDGDDFDVILSTVPPYEILEFDAEAGSFIYLPDADLISNDSFTCRANNDVDNSNLATVTIIANDHGQPITEDDSYIINDNIPLTSGTPGSLGNDTDTDSDDIHTIFITDPSYGPLKINAETDFLDSSPNTNFTGNCNLWQIDQKKYKSFDGFCSQ